jgi:hypothetical protein
MEKAIWWGLKSIAAPTRDPLRGLQRWFRVRRTFRQKKLEADEMFDTCRIVWHELIKASPHTARHFGYAVLKEKIQQYDEELDRVLRSRTYWEGVLSALKDRATGIDRTQQTMS